VCHPAITAYGTKGKKDCTTQSLQVGVEMPCFLSGYDNWKVVVCVAAIVGFSLAEAALFVATAGIGAVLLAVTAGGAAIAACQHCEIAECSALTSGVTPIMKSVNATLSGADCP